MRLIVLMNERIEVIIIGYSADTHHLGKIGRVKNREKTNKYLFHL